MERINLLISDLDDTLLGDDRALVEFSAWYEDARQHMRIAYTSGRFVQSVRDSIRAQNLPEPDAIIGGVGTQIYCASTGLLRDGWPPNLNHWDPETIRAIASAHKELEPQPDEFLSQFKISYFGYNLSDSFLSLLTRQLAAAGQRAEVIYSSRKDLDLLPAGTNKGSAARFLIQSWGMDSQRVMVAGNSGNDLEMFRQGFRGIVVGNALPELKLVIDPSVYHATGHHAAGVLEGVTYWLNGGSALRVRHGQPNRDRAAARDTHE